MPFSTRQQQVAALKFMKGIRIRALYRPLVESIRIAAEEEAILVIRSDQVVAEIGPLRVRGARSWMMGCWPK